MYMQDRSTLLQRIYHLKLIIVGGALVLLGLGLSLFADWLAGISGTSHLLVAVLQALSDVLLVTGAIGIAVDFFTGRDKEAADTERTRAVLKELTPDFTDAVLKGFAVNKDDLKRVANPELLDDIATNALSLRLGDDQFAAEIYADIRDQTIKAEERWYDVEVDLRLSTIVERSTFGTPLFDLVVQWEYTTIPSRAVRRFACVSDRDEFNELREEGFAETPWFMTPRKGVDPSSREAFELLSFSVEGKPQPIRRRSRKSGQTYSAVIDEALLRTGEPLRMKHVYRVVTQTWGHRLFVELPQPARNMSVTMDYTATPIVDMRVSDTVATARPVQVSRTPEEVSARTVTVDLPGWLLPRTGTAFTWTLESELPRDEARREAA
ncbi:MAG: hypothetical protein QM650_10605 [Microlunatus sp.]